MTTLDGHCEPATEPVLEEIPTARAGVEETDAAVARAKAALPAWRARGAGRPRAAAAAAIAARWRPTSRSCALLEARNAGKPIGDARGEIGMVVETFRYYAGRARAAARATRSPSPAAWR